MHKVNVRKMITAALLSTMGYVLSTFVSFPRMAPFQHFMNVITAVILGPWWAMACAALTGLMRMMLNGNTILAVEGGIFGACLSGLLYRKYKNLVAAVVGEVIGTGIISAIIAYPIMRAFYGLPDTSMFTYVPFFIPASFTGAIMGFMVLKVLNSRKVLSSIQLKVKGE